MADIDQNKIELLRTILPKGLSAGDGGLGNYSEKPNQTSNWPAFQSSTSETKLYTKSIEPSGYSAPSQQQQGAFEPHPWKVYLKVEDQTTKYKVEYNSNLYTSISSWNNKTVTGLDSWNNISEGFLILSGEVNNGECTKANVDKQNDVPDRITFGDESQTGFSVQIAYLYQAENNKWIVRQLIFQDLTLVNICSNGKSAIYPMAI